MREERLVEIHHLVHGPISGIQFEHRELGIVRRVDAFVAEDAPDFVDALETADDQPLQVEFRRDAHVERHVESVVMGAERTRGRAAGDVQQRRRLDFEETSRVAEAPHLRDDAASAR